MKHESTPTIKDVARESGLSLATVSKVINGLPVSSASRKRVEDAIEMLGYHVNPYARALKSNKSDTVALVMPSLKHPFFANLVDELTACLMHRGYRSLLMITNYDPQAEQKCFSMVRNKQVDGVIALTYNPNLVIDESIPIVTIDRHLSENIPCVSSDNYRGGELAAEKLIELGCRKLLFIRIRADIAGEPDKRLFGFENYCRTSKVDYDTLLLSDDNCDELIFSFLKEHFTSDSPDYDGIFCNTDIIACKTLRFLRENGVEVPEKVQIIGYDGILDFFSGQYICSTIRQPLSGMAEAAVDFLFSPIENITGINICLPVKYISAGTTKD